MVQGNQRLDAGGVHRFEHAAIRIQGRLIEAARLWLDARPLNGKTIGIQAHLLQQSNIVGPAVPGITRIA